MRGDGDPGDLARDLVRQPGRNVELGLARGIPGRVVVSALAGDDLDRWQGLRAVAEVDHPDRYFRAGNEPLDEGSVTIGEAAQHGAGQFRGGPDWSGTEGGTTAGRLDVQRQPELGDDE